MGKHMCDIDASTSPCHPHRSQLWYPFNDLQRLCRFGHLLTCAAALAFNLRVHPAGFAMQDAKVAFSGTIYPAALKPLS